MVGDDVALTKDSALDFNAAFSPDGRQIAFVSERDGNMEIYVVGVDGSGLKRLTDNFALDDHPTWSPNGQRIAFVSTRQSAPAGQAWNGIYTMRADGTDVTRLSPDGVADYSPAWSPRGDLIAFASGSGRSGDSDLYVMHPDGGQRRRVVENGGWPTFIDEGDAIAFHSRREGNRWDVWRINLDGSSLKQLAKNASMPRATTDGRRLALVVHGGPHQQIAVLDVETGKLTEVTTAQTDHWNPAVAGDGQRVAYNKRSAGKTTPNVQLWGAPPDTELNMLRLAGAFPAFSPDATRVALTGGSFAHVDVMNLDGTKRKSDLYGQKTQPVRQ